MESLFDFQAYLQSLTPAISWDIEKLDGGIVNITVRASQHQQTTSASDDLDDGGASVIECSTLKEANADHATSNVIITNDPSIPCNGVDPLILARQRSMILKFAPPYIAAVGPEAPFDNFRQIIEARALSLLSPSPWSSSSALPSAICSKSGVEVPQLIFYDPSNNLLGISDLGCLENLSDHLLSFISKAIPQIQPRFTLTDDEHLDLSAVSKHYSLIGQSLGNFLALLHSPHTITQIQSSTSISSKSTPSPSYLFNPSREPLIFSEAIAPLKHHLLKFPNLISASEANNLYHLIEENFTQAIGPEEACLMMGDCWTGAILLESCQPQHPRQSDSHKRTDSGISITLTPNPTVPPPRLAMIDWEFATFHRARGLDGDTAQLLAHLVLHQILACHHRNRILYVAVTEMVLALAKEYDRRSRIEGAVWTKPDVVVVQKEEHEQWQCGRGGEREWRKRFLISLGAEMLNAACWREWPCRRGCCCGSSGDRYGGGGEGGKSRKWNCGLVHSFVKRGLKVLRDAMDTSEIADGDRNGTRTADSVLEDWVRRGMVDFHDEDVDEVLS